MEKIGNAHIDLWGFPGCPVVRTQHFLRGGAGSVPGWEPTCQVAVKKKNTLFAKLIAMEDIWGENTIKGKHFISIKGKI